MEFNIKLLDTVIEAAKHFLQAMITPPLEQVGRTLADSVKSKKVSLKVMAPLLEECSLEDDENLQEKWAPLLAK